MSTDPSSGESPGRWGRGSFGTSVEMDSDLVIKSIHQVPIAVHSYLDRTVSQTGLNRLRMLPIGDQPCGVSMTQVVNAERWAD